MRLLMLAMSLSVSVFSNPCTELFMDSNHGATKGLTLLDAGENTKAAQYFKDELAYKETLCKGQDVNGPYENLYVTVADYRRGNYGEAKEYLLKMFAQHEKYFSYDLINVGYACLIATKTEDAGLLKVGLSFVDQKFSWGMYDNKEFAISCMRHANKNMVLDAKTKQLINEKLTIIEQEK